MECSYCKKPPPGGIVLELTEDVPGEGPTRRKACFLCLQLIAERIMRPILNPEPSPEPTKDPPKEES